MLRNNNSGVVRRLANSSLKSSKMRNFFIMLTIALSVSLLTGIILFFTGMNESEKRQIDKMQHVIYHDVTDEQIASLEGSERIESIRLYKQGKSSEIENYIVVPNYVEQKETNMEIPKITKGKYPEALNEIAVDVSYMKQIERTPVLGEKLSFTFLDGVTEEFVISGFTDIKNTSTVYTLLLSKEYSEKGSQLKDTLLSAPVKIKNAKNMSDDDFYELIRGIGVDCGIPRRNINENNAFVYSLSVSGNEIITIAVVLIAITFVSILVIYSVFYISVVSRVQQFGQLRTLGATQRQIKSMVRKEGVALSLRSAPIGLLIGIIFAYFVKPDGFSWMNTIVTCIIILLVNLLTVLVSISKPAKLAASISPIEATKGIGAESNFKNCTTHKLHRKLTPGTLANMNTNRNRKKSLLTLISLGVGGVIFISGATVLTSMNRQEYSRQKTFKDSEYSIYFSENAVQSNEMGNAGIQINNPINDKLINHILDVDHVESVTPAKRLEVKYEYKDVRTDDGVVSFGRESDALLQKSLIEGKYNYDSMIANREVLVFNNSVAKEIFGWKFGIGDSVKLSWFNGTEMQDDVFKIVGSLESSSKVSNILIDAGWFIMPDEALNTLVSEGFNLNNTAAVKINNFEKYGTEVESQIRGIVEESPTLMLDSLRERLIADEATYNGLLGTIIGFAAFIIAFSLINLVNTLSTNIITRKREFAMLQSIGMENRQLTKMIQIEGIIIAAKNMLITLVFGTVCGIGLVAFMNSNGADYMHYKFPIIYAIIYLVIIVLAPIVISHFAINSFVKKSLVERLRENV